MRKEVWGFRENVIIFLDEELIGGQEEFLKWAMDNHGYKDFRSAVKNSFQISLIHSIVAVGFLRPAVKFKQYPSHTPKSQGYPCVLMPKRSDFY